MIRGKRITLRAVEREDLPRFIVWLNDPEVTRHLNTFLPFNLEDETDWYERQRQDETTLNLAIVINEGEQHIGAVGLLLWSTMNRATSPTGSPQPDPLWRI